jgi:hypothetical protein
VEEESSVERRPLSVAGWASIALGVTYVFVGIGYLLQPEAQASGNIDEYLISLSEGAFGWTMVQIATVAGGIFAFGAVPAIAELGDREWSVWAKNLGLAGFLVATVTAMRALELVPSQAADFVNPFSTDPARLEVPLMVLRGDNFGVSVDPRGWLSYGAVGLFVLMTVIAALRRRTMPTLLALAGIGAALGYFLVVASEYLDLGFDLVTFAAGAAIVLGPIFYIWSGLLLRSAAPDAEQVTPASV